MTSTLGSDPIDSSPALITKLKKGAISGVISLSIRRILAQVIMTSGNIILARLIFPREFGIFALITLFMGLFGLASDIGLSGAIIQSAKVPTKPQLQSIFVVQLVLGSLTTLIMWLSAPLLFQFYGTQLGNDGIFYIQLGAFGIILHNLKLIPNALLEKHLEFKKLAVAELIEMAIIPLVTIILVLNHFGAVSFIISMLVARATSVLIYYALSPWPIGLKFSVHEIKSLLPFGLSFQASQIINTVSSSIAQIVTGLVAGVSALGLLNWAAGVGAVPQIIGEIVGRILFPLTSQVQKDLKLFQRSVERSIQFSSMVALPMVALIMALAYPITYIIFTDKWISGVPTLYLFTLQSYLMVLNTILTSALFATGQSKAVRNINFFRLIAQILFTIPLVVAFGIIGYAAASLIISATFFVSIIELKKTLHFQVLKYSLPYLIYSTISGGLVALFAWRYPIRSVIELIAAASLGGVTYVMFLLLFDRKLILSYLLPAFKRGASLYRS